MLKISLLPFIISKQNWIILFRWKVTTILKNDLFLLILTFYLKALVKPKTFSSTENSQVNKMFKNTLVLCFSQGSIFNFFCNSLSMLFVVWSIVVFSISCVPRFLFISNRKGRTVKSSCVRRSLNIILNTNLWTSCKEINSSIQYLILFDNAFQ